MREIHFHYFYSSRKGLSIKRFPAAAVTPTTALSLSVAPATAAEKGSSAVSEAEVFGYIVKQGAKDVFGGDGFASSVDYGIKKGIESASSKDEEGSSSSDSGKEGQKKEKSSVEDFQRDLETADSGKDFAMPSLKNDTAKEYLVGTTAEILAGTSIAAVVLGLIAAVVNGVNSGFLKIPGFNA